MLYLVKLFGVVDEEARLFAVGVHKMLLRHLKGLFHALSDSNGRHNDDKLGKAVSLVQLKHRLDIDIGLSRTRFHFYIKVNSTQRARQSLGLADIRDRLYVLDIVEKHTRRKFNAVVCKAYIIVVLEQRGRRIHIEQAHLCRLLSDTHIHCVLGSLHIGLTLEHIGYGVDRVRLILLYFKTKFHKALKDRVKTSNTEVYYTVSNIHSAISKNGKYLKKIKFQYLKYTIQDLRNYSERRQGIEYVVVPHSLIIDNGNYYLLGYDVKKEEVRTYRVDRMKNLKVLDEPFFETDVFDGIDIERYTQGHFGMFGGERNRVRLNCSIRLLNTMVDRFGLDDVVYQEGKEGFFNVTATIYVSDHFFGWLASFGTQVSISSPSHVKNDYAAYLKKISKWHSKFVDK